MLKSLAVAAVAAVGLGVAGTAHADPPPNIIVGTPGLDFLVGTQHRDVILGRRGNDFEFGRRGSDVLRGGFGNDTLRDWRYHQGTDVLNGGRGVDVCIGNPTDTFRNCETIIRRLPRA